MPHKSVAITLVIYATALFVAAPFGINAAVAVYVAVAAAVVATNLRAAQQRRPGTLIHISVATGVFGFAVGQFLYAQNETSVASEVVFLLSYVAAGGAGLVLVKQRIRELSVVAGLEAAILAVSSLGAGTGLGLVLTDGFTPGVTFYAALPLVVFGGLAVLGRSGGTRTLRLYFVTIILAVIVEGVEGVGVWSASSVLLVSSMALVPLIFVGTSKDEGAMGIERGVLAKRRQVGLLHVVGVVLGLAVIPTSLGLETGFGDGPITLAVTCYLVLLALVGWRFALLIKERDEDHAREVELRRLGERLVASVSVDEMVVRALRTAASVVVNDDAWICRLDPSGDVTHEQKRAGARRPPLDDLIRVAGRGSPSEVISSTLNDGRSMSVFGFRDRELGSIVVVSARPVAEIDEPYVQAVSAQLELALTAASLREQRHQERSNRRFRALVQDSNDVVLLVEPKSMQTTLVSPTVRRLLGYDEADFIGVSPLSYLHPDDVAAAETLLSQRRDVSEPLDVRLVPADGRFHWFALTIRDLTDDDDLAGFVLNLTDINARKLSEVQLSSSETRYRTLIEQSDDVFALVADDLHFTFVSPNCERLTGYPAADLVGSHVNGMLTPESFEGLRDFFALEPDELSGRAVEAELKTRHGDLRSVVITVTDVDLDDGDGVMVAVRDVTERRELEESMRHAALHDQLTGLYNRSSIQHELNRYLQQMEQDQQVGVVHVDVRNFKVVNESLGFDVGDQLLIEVAGRLRAGLRTADVLGRLGADSFVVITTVTSPAELASFVARLNAVFNDTFVVRDRQHHLAVSIGSTVTTDRRESPVTLLEEAALAVRRAKGSSGPVVYESWLREAATERFELEADLLPGLAAGQFSVVYQPLFSLTSNQVRGVEALMRWQHPERGHVSPGTFIPLAENSGAITELGRWVLQTSCQQLATWHRELPDAAGLGMSVNVSARQLEDNSEFEVFHEIIRSSGVNPASLTLELTETTVLDGIESIRQQLEGFRALGIKIAVDDFGTGTAGLNHLRDVPFDVLKVDKTYVDPLGKTEDAYALLSGVVELAHAMGAVVVAEGIETPQQAEQLRRMHCDVGQGFYLGRPMDLARLEHWFARGRDGSFASQIQQLQQD